MEAYQQRVVDEKKALDDNISKLNKFLSNPPVPLDVVDRELMGRQLSIMRDLSQVLGERIARFNT